MAEKIVQFIESRVNLMLGIMVGIQIVGAVALFFLDIFVALADGGVEVVGKNYPEINAACITLPCVFLLTFINAAIYPEQKGRKWARWLLIFTVVVNVAVPIGIVWLWLMLFFR